MAHGTTLNIFLYKLHKTQPPEFSSNELAGFEITGVSSSFVVMAADKDGTAERVLWGDIDTTFVGQNVVTELPVREVRPESSRDVFQGRLQVLEDKGVGLGQVADALVQFGVNEVDKSGVREEDGQRVVGVVRVEVWAVGEGIRSSKEAAWDMDDLEIKVSKVK